MSYSGRRDARAGVSHSVGNSDGRQVYTISLAGCWAVSVYERTAARRCLAPCPRGVGGPGLEPDHIPLADLPADGQRWNADVRLLRLFSRDKPRVEKITWLQDDGRTRGARGRPVGETLDRQSCQSCQRLDHALVLRVRATAVEWLYGSVPLRFRRSSRRSTTACTRFRARSRRWAAVRMRAVAVRINSSDLALSLRESETGSSSGRPSSAAIAAILASDMPAGGLYVLQGTPALAEHAGQL